jgi:methylmalonyl-CoA/ethylmalonyl-CoA epimerase
VIDNIVLDHVAVALERRADAWPRYGGDLPGIYLGGGEAWGFANYQVEYANGMRLEVLEPANVDRNDFLRRFLDRSGPGPHHLTYKVKDIHAAIAEIESAGFHPVGVNVESPHWKELFLHPKEVPGIVIQVAQSEGGHWEVERPAGYPAPRTPTAASLVRIVHAVADLGDGQRVFVDLLGGTEERQGRGPEGRWVDLAWPGPGRVRLVEQDVPARAGALHHLLFETDDPADVPGAVHLGEGDLWEVPPEANFGTRLRLRPSHVR